MSAELIIDAAAGTDQEDLEDALDEMRVQGELDEMAAEEE